MGTVEGRQETGRGQRSTTAAAYLLLFVLGAVQGLIGSFQYSQAPAPLVAILLDLVILATCLFCGWGTRAFAGGLVPAVGWIVASFIMSMGNAQGSIIITNTTSGMWYLYGGALAAAVGASAAFVFWTRAQSRR
jgi:hypothetical protein